MILVSKKSRFAEPGMKKIVNYVKKRKESYSDEGKVVMRMVQGK